VDNEDMENGMIDEIDQKSQLDSENDITIDDIQYAKSNILSPTCVTIIMSVPKALYKKIKINDFIIECEPLFLNLDYKDIDLLYYLNIRYTQCIYPALEKMWEPMDFMPELKET
jgi:hypothetical protein